MEKTLLLITRSGQSNSPNDLQNMLIMNFFKTLLKENNIPNTIFFYSDGIKLNQHGSVIEDLLIEVETRGSTIYTCAISLDYFNALPELVTGTRGGMTDLIRLIDRSDKVIAL
jgi:hypothetical protein